MLLLATGILAAVGATIYFGVKIFAPWLRYDIDLLRKMSGALKSYDAQMKSKTLFLDLFDETVKKHPNKKFIIFHEDSYTYKEVDERANQVARAVMKMGVKAGDVIGVMMCNEPAFIWTYIGLQKIGVQQALINYNLRSKSLLHCIKVCDPKLLVLGKGKNLQDAITEIQDSLTGITVYSNNESPLPTNFRSFTEVCSSASKDAIDLSERSSVILSSVNCFIFTSGTTGLPKPAIVTQMKTLGGLHFMDMLSISNDDVVYNTLPLYHSAGLLIGVGSVASVGATVVLREKFSASRFWEDCRKHKVTIIQYIGELLRYLVNTPETSEDTNHCVKYAFGNGLRSDVWTEFQRRFKVPNVVEFYGATEMPIFFINVSNKIGACGRNSPFLQKIMPSAFIKYDVQTDEPVRNQHGLCMACGADDVGLLVIPLGKDKTFEGYKNQEEATKKKILHNVFKEGDMYINTGDLMYTDKDYFIYFHDRVGDTFRWKGENVSTTEVTNVVGSVEFLSDCCVYGVQVNGCEGRAGMATVCHKNQEKAILSQEELDVIGARCKDVLPSYARPKFIRLQGKLEITSTFKQSKMTLKKEGFDIRQISDPVYLFDSSSDQYVPLTLDMVFKINNGEMIM